MKILDKLESLDCSQVARSDFRLPLMLLALLLVSACSGGSEQSFEPDPSSDNLQADNLQTDTDSAVVDADMSQIAEVKLSATTRSISLQAASLRKLLMQTLLTRRNFQSGILPSVALCTLKQK